MNQENQVLENQLLANFQVEELEKRYEFGWSGQPEVNVNVNVINGGTSAGGGGNK